MYGTLNDGHDDDSSPPSASAAARSLGRAALFLLLPLLFLLTACEKPVAKVGAVLPLTGPDAALGEAAKKSLEASLASIPESTLQLEILDSASNPAQAAQRGAELIENGAVALIGGTTPAEARSLARIAEEKERVVILTSASEQSLTAASKWVYRLGASDSEAGATFATFANQRFKNESAAILASDADYANSILDGFETTFESLGGELVHTVENGGEALEEGVKEIAGKRPDLTVLAGDATWQKDAAAALRRAGYSGKLFANRHVLHPAVAKEAAKSKLLFAYSGLDYSEPQEGAQSFVAGFEGLHGSAPEALTAQVAAESWDALQILHMALQDRPVMSSEIRRGLRDQVKAYAGASGSLEFDDTGSVTSFPRVYSFTSRGELRDHGEHLDRRSRRVAEQRRVLQQRLENLQAGASTEGG